MVTPAAIVIASNGHAGNRGNDRQAPMPHSKASAHVGPNKDGIANACRRGHCHAMRAGMRLGSGTLIAMPPASSRR